MLRAGCILAVTKQHSPEALTLAIAGGQMLWAVYWHASPCISCARSGLHALA